VKESVNRRSASLLSLAACTSTDTPMANQLNDPTGPEVELLSRDVGDISRSRDLDINDQRRDDVTLGQRDM
jgi:hypothetical protein